MKQTQKITFGGMMAALGVVLLMLASILPLFVFAVPAIAGLLLVPVCIECSPKWGFGVYAVTAVLALLLVPDREAAFFYVGLFGHYPVLKTVLERIRQKSMRAAAKGAVFLVSAALCLLATALVFGLDYLLTEYLLFGAAGAAVLGLIALVALYLYDTVIGRIAILYIRMLQPKLRHLFRS